MERYNGWFETLGRAGHRDASAIARPYKIWGQMMTLGELLEGIEQLDNDLTIYAAKPWTVHSEARVEIGDDSTSPRRGLDYLLDVDTAQDVIEAWTVHRDGAIPTVAERCEALVYYEGHDAYLIPGGYDPAD